MAWITAHSNENKKCVLVVFVIGTVTALWSISLKQTLLRITQINSHFSYASAFQSWLVNRNQKQKWYSIISWYIFQVLWYGLTDGRVRGLYWVPFARRNHAVGYSDANVRIVRTVWKAIQDRPVVNLFKPFSPHVGPIQRTTKTRGTVVRGQQWWGCVELLSLVMNAQGWAIGKKQPVLSNL